MFSLDNEWNSGVEEEQLNLSLFSDKTSANVNLISYNKILTSSDQRHAKEIQKSKSQTNGEEGEKKKVTFTADEVKARSIDAPSKKKKKKKKGHEDKINTELSDTFGLGCLSSNDSACVEEGKCHDHDGSEETLGSAICATLKERKRKRKLDAIEINETKNIGMQETGVGQNSNDFTNNAIDDPYSVKDFNDLYSDSDEISITPKKKQKKGKRKKDNEREGDVLVISESNRSLGGTKKDEQKEHIQFVEGDNQKVSLDCPAGALSSKVKESEKKQKKDGRKLKQLNTKKKKNDKDFILVNNADKCAESTEGIIFPAPLSKNSMINKAIVTQSKSSRTNSKYNRFQQKLMEKLKGGQFRWINERLYSCASSEAVNMFVTEPSLFDVYHEGFHAQVQQWPQNPVDAMLQYVKKQGKDVVVADFGCGDAKLASALPNKVHSFDLVAVNERVTACDMKKVPLKAKSVDIAVFCLSLMGTNLVDFLMEAHRVIKEDGILKIAEVKSRFDDVEKFIGDVCSLGFSFMDKDDSNKMFIMLEFQKTSEPNSKRATNITLNPCIYKRR